MPIQLITAPPAGGKTQYVLERVLMALAIQPLSSPWVVVPDRIQRSDFRRRLAQAGGAVGAQVVTFQEFSQEILERAGQPLPAPSEGALAAFLRAAVEEVWDAGDLDHYGSIRSTPGFLRALHERFTELQRAGVDAHVYAREQTGGPPQRELAALYHAYERLLESNGWAGLEELNVRASDALGTNPGLLDDCPLAVFDGFDEYGPTRRRLLHNLNRAVPTTLITLPASRTPRQALERLARVRQEIEIDLQPEVIELQAEPYLSPAIRRLEAEIFGPPVNGAPRTPTGEDSEFWMLEARSPAEEGREALRWIKSRLVRAGLAPWRCAIYLPDHDLYAPALRAAAAEFGLRLRFTRGEPLDSAPPVAALLDLLALPVEDWPRALTLATVRSPYFNLAAFHLASQDAGALERLSAAMQVTGGLKAWLEALQIARGEWQVANGRWQREQGRAEIFGSEDETVFEEEDGVTPPQAPQGAEAERLLHSLRSLASRLEPEESQTLSGWVRWLESLLEELGFFRRLAAGSEAAAGQALVERLRGLLLGEAVSGPQRLAITGWLAWLRSALESGRYYPEPEEGAAVLVGHIGEARGGRYRAVAILGLAEGVYPQVERADPFLPEAERARLGLEPQLGRGQGVGFYLALARSDSSLLLTRPYLAEGGESWEPSPYWLAAQKLCPQPPVRVRTDGPRPLESAASPAEALFWACLSGTDLETSFASLEPALATRAARVSAAIPVLLARLARRPEGDYEGFPSAVAADLAARYGSDAVWSASRLETYAACPHRFWVEKALALEARRSPEVGYDLAQLGAMLHNLLEAAYRTAVDPADPEYVIDALHQIAALELPQAPGRWGFRPGPLWGEQQAQILTTLEESIIALATNSTGWQPAYFEAAFGRGSLPALQIEGLDGPVHLSGVIDRVDRDSAGRLRVIDYKTGSGHLGPDDLENGRRLQLPLYALAAQEALGLGETVEGLYWSIRSAKPGGLRLSRFRGEEDSLTGITAAITVASEHVFRTVRSVQEAQFPPVPPADGCPTYCAGAAWCWRYRPGFAG